MATVAFRSSRSLSYRTSSESSALTLRVGEADSTGAPKPRLLDRVRAAIRARHYSRRTEKAYVAWIRRYIFFHDKRHPADMGAPEVTRFLSYNVFNYEPAFSAIGSRGSYYADGAKIGMAVGALLAVGGIFSYIEGWRRGTSS